MKPPLPPLLYSLSHRSTRFLSLTRKPFSSVSTRKPIWTSKSNVIITNPTLLIMESCTTMFELKQIQAQMTRNGLIFHLFPVSRVLSFCALADSGDIHHAHLLFAQIPEPNVYIWNTMVRGYCKEKLPTMGFSLFRRMVQEQVEMDERSFVFALKACEQFPEIVEGKSVHCIIYKVGFVSDLVVQNGLIHYYADHGFLSFARQLFDECSVRDVVTWTTMIDGYRQDSCPDEAMKLFDSMLLSAVEPNEVTMITVLSACSLKGDLNLGERIHEYIKKTVYCGINLLNALLDMYVKCGCLITAKNFFDKMETRDAFSWTSMVSGYAKLGDLDFARSLFMEMPERNVVSWNAMISGYSQNNRPKEALYLFHDMIKTGVVPIESTLVSVLSACAQSGCLVFGQWIHHYYVNGKHIQLSVILANAFIDMYSKCGSIDAAAEVFHEMSKRDLVSWNSMIVGYASHGHAEQALSLFEQMARLDFKPDEITFVGVLSACSHGGLVTEGWEYFRNMKRNFGVEPKVEHYACMIDLLGRIGLINEAYDLMMEMPMDPDVAAWGALLNACRIHGNVELGMLAAKKLMDLDPKDSGIYVLLANICAKGRRWDDVKMVRGMMRKRRIKKTPGCSSIEVEGKFHKFLVADESHPQSEEIYKMLNEMLLPSNMEHDVANTFQMNLQSSTDDFSTNI